ncbi:MAG: GTPase [Planctomycetota bacterium]
MGLRDLEDTIVACASPPGGSARAIVRLSGSRALAFAQACFEEPSGLPWPADTWKPHSRLEGLFRLASEEDKPGEKTCVPAAVYVMRAPRTYTREDVVEFHLPGAPGIVEAAVGTCLALGARLAGPGEFTLRAFLSGRIDLAQAEAVEAVIGAAGEGERRAALSRMEGIFSGRVNRWRRDLVALAAEVEASLDFEPDEVEPLPREAVRRGLEDLCLALDGVLAQARSRERREGMIPVYFAGPTNAGKSSLLNALLGRAEAVVSPEPSTTRDRLDFALAIEPFQFLLQDAPGYDGQGGPLAALASEHSLAGAEEAGIVLLLADESLPLSNDLLRIARALPPVPVVLVLNKTDLGLAPGVEEDLQRLAGAAGIAPRGTVAVSALTGENLPRLRRALVDIAVEDMEHAAAGGSLNRRMADCLAKAREALRRARGLVAEGEPELLAEELRGAHGALGLLVGEGYADEVLESIFSRFCIGK